MSRLPLLEKGWVPTAAWEIFTRAENRLGWVPHLLKVMAHNLRCLRAVDELLVHHDEQGLLEPELRLLAALAAAGRNGNPHGVDWVKRQARRYAVPDEKVAAAVAGRADAEGFTPCERAVVRFALAMTDRADAGTQALAALADHLTEAKIVELAFVVAARNFLDRLEATFALEAEPELQAELR